MALHGGWGCRVTIEPDPYKLGCGLYVWLVRCCVSRRCRSPASGSLHAKPRMQLRLRGRSRVAQLLNPRIKGWCAMVRMDRVVHVVLALDASHEQASACKTM